MGSNLYVCGVGWETMGSFQCERGGSSLYEKEGHEEQSERKKVRDHGE